ncbi:hypothetical protein DTB58_19190 [Streptomyces griseus]|nr:hypothetical protein [Streptomyces griseus]
MFHVKPLKRPVRRGILIALVAVSVGDRPDRRPPRGLTRRGGRLRISASSAKPVDARSSRPTA